VVHDLADILPAGAASQFYRCDWDGGGAPEQGGTAFETPQLGCFGKTMGVYLLAASAQSWYQDENGFRFLSFLEHRSANAIRVNIPVNPHSSSVFRYDYFTVKVPLAEPFLECLNDHVNNALAKRINCKDPRPVDHVFDVAFLDEFTVELVKFVVV